MTINGIIEKSSRLPGFYRFTREERIALVADWAGFDSAEKEILLHGGLTPDIASAMIENCLTTYGLPMGLATNFLINGRERLIPMVIEEPSVVAAVSYAAKLARPMGGFVTHSTDPVMIGQIQLLDIPDWQMAMQAILDHKAELMEEANSVSRSIVKRGGGSRDITVRYFATSPVGPMLVVHLLYDCRDAMGANAINTAVEQIAPRVAELSGGRAHLRILSNLSDQRLATASCTISAEALTNEDAPGTLIAQRIVEANAFAVVDPYRATTHNKGIMNGIDAVCLATGNDWRAIEAGAHAYAARNGHYSSLTDWHLLPNGDLYGSLTLPLAVGIVGGATKVHPHAQLAIKLLGVESATELAEIMAAVGLAQNLAAIKALATTGIQKGHMKLHARQIALAAGASAEQVQAIADQLVKEGKIRVQRAQELLAQNAH